nr:MAG TPA: hypothetical protein [Caudoviricetes sp.]
MNHLYNNRNKRSCQEDNKNYSSCPSSFSFQSFSCLIKALRSSSSFL